MQKMTISLLKHTVSVIFTDIVFIAFTLLYDIISRIKKEAYKLYEYHMTKKISATVI